MNLQNNRYLSRTAFVLIFIQPICLLIVYSSIFFGYPPALLAWSLSLASVIPICIIQTAFFQRTPFDIPILMLIIGLTIGLAFSPYKEISFETYQTYILCAITYYVIVFNGLRNMWYWRLVITIIALLLVIVVILTFAQNSPSIRILPYNEWIYIAASKLPFSLNYHLTVNTLGTVVGISAPGLIGYAIFLPNHRDKVVAWVLGVLATVLVIFTSSSAGLISMLIGFAFILWLWRRWMLYIFLPFGICWLWLVLNNNLYLPDWAMWLLPRDTLVERLEIWKGTLQLLVNSHFVGLGPGVWYLRSNLLVNGWPPINQHNDILTLISDGGILAGVTYFWVMVIVGMKILRIKDYPAENHWRALGLAIAASLVALAVNGIFETTVTGTLRPIPVGDMMYRYKCLAVPTVWALLALLTIAQIHLSNTQYQGKILSNTR